MKKTLIVFFFLVALMLPQLARSLTVEKEFCTTAGNKYLCAFTITWGSTDTSYSTGGDSLTAKNLGFHSVEAATFNRVNGYDFEYDIANGKILVYTSPDATYHIKALATPSSHGPPVIAQPRTGHEAQLYQSSTSGRIMWLPYQGTTGGALFTYNSAISTDDAANGYMKVYVDTSEADTFERLKVNNTDSGKDLLVPVDLGKFIKLNHTAAASTNSTVFFDANAAARSDTLIYYVSSASTDLAITTDRDYSLRWGECPAGTNLYSEGLTAQMIVIGY